MGACCYSLFRSYPTSLLQLHVIQPHVWLLSTYSSTPALCYFSSKNSTTFFAKAGGEINVIGRHQPQFDSILGIYQPFLAQNFSHSVCFCINSHTIPKPSHVLTKSI